MSKRELKILKAGKESHLQGSRLRSGRIGDSESELSGTYSGVDLESLVKELRAENEQLKCRNQQVEEELEQLQSACKESSHLEKLLVEAQMDVELSHY